MTSGLSETCWANSRAVKWPGSGTLSSESLLHPQVSLEKQASSSVWAGSLHARRNISQSDSCIFKNVHSTKVILRFPQESHNWVASLFDASCSGKVFQNSLFLLKYGSDVQDGRKNPAYRWCCRAPSMFFISFKYFMIYIGNMCSWQRPLPNPASHIFHELLQIWGIIKMGNICMLAARSHFSASFLKAFLTS